MKCTEIYIVVLVYFSAYWLSAPDWLDQSGDRRAMAEVLHGGGAILRYSPIHIKIIYYRMKSNFNAFYLDPTIYNRIESFKLLKGNRRGKRGGK